MKPLDQWVHEALSLSVREFCARHPGPFLVWPTERGPDLATLGLGTIDRVMIGTHQPKVTPMIEGYFAAAIHARAGGPVVSLGCDLSRDIQINDGSVSRQHAVLMNGGGRWRIRDTNSLTGTYVCDEPANDAPLESGDRITVGNVDLLFLDSSALYELIRRLEEFG